MSKFLVAGIVQIETIVKVETIPINYEPVRSMPNTIFTSVGGDAYNTSLALTWLGNTTDFMSLIGESENKEFMNPTDREVTIYTNYVLPRLSATPTAVVLYDESRKQQIFEDIKNLRDVDYDMEFIEDRVSKAEMVVLSNANFCRPFIKKAKEMNKTIAVNIREYKEGNVIYNKDFLEAADIIYISDDNLVVEPFEFVRSVADTFDPEIIILGQGEKGVILFSKKMNILAHYNAVRTNEIVNTVGAGNALFSCFLHYYCKEGDPVVAIKNALLFASYKIGFVGTSNGFMTEDQIAQWRNFIWK